MTDNSTQKLIDNLYSKVNYYYPDDSELIGKAYGLANKAHEGQLRASGRPYITHPLQVADILIDLGLDTATICAALLHDTVEDTQVTDALLREQFGEEIADLVRGVTKLEKIQFNSIEEEQAENIRKMMFAMAKDIRVIIIKLADRLHNMRSLHFLSADRQIAMAQETQEIYALLAGRLGISPIKCELEDLALKYLKPDVYNYLAENLSTQVVERRDVLDRMISDLKTVLVDADVQNFEISGRTKHFNSIYRKMKSQNKTLDQIFDITGVRIIVETVKDCYSVLGIIHAKWKPIPGRFKDYIAVPKPNLYQSLHTTIITTYGMPYEIQIRTYDMNKIAEYGIAAHWKYKENISGQKDVSALSWIQEILNASPDLKDSREFLDLFKRDITITDEVYVFTPRGDVRAMALGANALDFAYAIHSEIGNHCVGTKINGKIVPIDKTLETGDVVEVLTNPSSKGPSRDWLKIVKTSSAKAKIRQFFKRELKDEYIKSGKAMLERDAKQKGFVLNNLLTKEAVASVCDRYSFSTLDEVLASVGYGGVSINQIMVKLIAANKKAGLITELPQQAARRPSTKESSVNVKGTQDMLVRFSGCCSPVPGDEIIGYISRGRGVCVHRSDCPSLKGLETDRLVETSWAFQSSDKANFPATIQVVSEDRGEVFADITKTVANEKLPLLAINARKDKNHNAIATLTVEITNNNQVNNLINKLQAMPNTIKVFRTTK